ncbi:MAG: 30S ribosomal protein S9 [Acidilobus sp.]
MSEQAGQGSKTEQVGQQVLISIGKRKTATARAYIRPGKGRVRVNGIPIEIWPVEVARLKMSEPLIIAGDAVRSLVDIDVSVKGGGFMGQAEAVRMAVARGLVDFFEKCVASRDSCDQSKAIAQKLRNLYMEYDRTMLAGDQRRTEPEKYMRYSARRKWQTSYR